MILINDLKLPFQLTLCFVIPYVFHASLVVAWVKLRTLAGSSFLTCCRTFAYLLDEPLTSCLIDIRTNGALCWSVVGYNAITQRNQTGAGRTWRSNEAVLKFLGSWFKPRCSWMGQGTSGALPRYFWARYQTLQNAGPCNELVYPFNYMYMEQTPAPFRGPERDKEREKKDCFSVPYTQMNSVNIQLLVSYYNMQ